MTHSRPLELVHRTASGSAVVVSLDRGTALLGLRPRPSAARLTDTDDGAVLVSENGSTYLRLSRDEREIWLAVDGKATVSEIVTAWFLRRGSLDVRRVTAFMQVLRRAGFIEMAPVGFLRSRLGSGALALEWRWTGMHTVAAAVHAAVGGMFSTWTAPIWASITALGAWSWWADARVVSVDVPNGWVVLAVSAVLHVVVHELAHAVAVVAAGRRVRHLGIGLGGVYVDTTDLYLGTRKQHAIAAIAGPVSNVVLAALLSVLAHAAPPEWSSPLRVAAQAGVALAAFTGWPFPLDNDGYRALSDLTGEPHLRRTSASAVMAGKASAPQVLWFVGSVLTVVAVAALTWMGATGLL